MRKAKATTASDKQQTPAVWYIESDPHAGSTVAICPPEVQLDDGGYYKASRAQNWLWDCRTEALSIVAKLRTQLGAKLYYLSNGDVTDGDHHGTTQILSGNPTAQAAVVDAIMKPILALRPDGLAFVRGTEAHVGKSACYEERIAKGLLKDGWPVITDAATGNASHWHFRAEMHGVRLDFAHHGRVGTRPWTKATGPMTLAAEIGYNHFRRGEPHPHIAVRSHMHQYFDTHDAHPVRVIQTPCWQLATSYIHRIAPDNLADIGAVIVVLQEGEPPEVRPMLYRPDPSPVWKP